MILQRFYVSVVLLFLLAGCQTFVPQETSTQSLLEFEKNDFLLDYEQLQALSSWNLKGAFSFANDADSGQGKIIWTSDNRYETGLNTEVQLLGPFGAGAVRLESSNGGASLSQGKKVWNDVSAEALLEKVLHWRIPVEPLSYWLFGLPHPDIVGRYQLDESGHMIILQQSGWDITFKQYQKVGLLKRDLPRKIFATHAESNTRVRLVVSQRQTL
ncbi:MAG: lipoprotein insertase outer membrane protein LolB [Arenicella sp.]